MKIGPLDLRIRRGALYDPKVEGTEKKLICPFRPWKASMTMEKQPFEDVSPIENGDLPLPEFETEDFELYLMRVSKAESGKQAIRWQISNQLAAS